MIDCSLHDSQKHRHEATYFTRKFNADVTFMSNCQSIFITTAKILREQDIQAQSELICYVGTKQYGNVASLVTSNDDTIQ